MLISKRSFYFPGHNKRYASIRTAAN